MRTVLEAEPRSSLWKLLTGVLKPKLFDFPDVKLPGSPTEPSNFWFRAELTWMRIRCNAAALLDFPIVIGPNGSNSDSKTSRHMEGVTLKIVYPPFYRLFFHSGSVVVVVVFLFCSNSFRHICDVKHVSDVQHHLQMNITDGLPCRQEVAVWSRAAVAVFKYTQLWLKCGITEEACWMRSETSSRNWNKPSCLQYSTQRHHDNMLAPLCSQARF